MLALAMKGLPGTGKGATGLAAVRPLAVVCQVNGSVPPTIERGRRCLCRFTLEFWTALHGNYRVIKAMTLTIRAKKVM